MGGKEVGFLGAVRAGAEVDVVRAQHHSGEFGVCVGVFDGYPAPDEHPGAAIRRGQTGACDTERFRPGGRAELAVFVADERGGDAVTLGGVGERPATFVAVPLLVDLRIVTGQAAQHFSAPVVGALGATRRAVLAYAGTGHQVERPGPESVGRTGERTDRADLHGVAGVVRLKRFT